MKTFAQELYNTTKNTPLICPHGHVDPALFSDPAYRFGSPVDLLIIPDHYVFRMLYSQGIRLEQLGIARLDGQPVETDHRKIWQLFAENFYLFRGTPTGVWLHNELKDVFGIDEKLSAKNANEIYDALVAKLQEDAFQPRKLFEQFNIEILATTDAATDTLEHHQRIQASDWQGRIIPTFRPDAVITINDPRWHTNIELLGDVSGVDVKDYASFIQAIEQRRDFFKAMGATATDHGTQHAYTEQLSRADAENIFLKALQGQASAKEAMRFTGHMLLEMARMSCEDGLVMQMHIGSYRNHNPYLFETFGRDMGADIPVKMEFTQTLRPLLTQYGNHPDLTMILFTLDESTYGRELAPLAGHYPALRLGPPWWFFDSPNGIRRYLDTVIETAGIYNSAGFNDDTRAFPSIPARHDVWRRTCATWLASQVETQVIDEEDAHAMMLDLAYNLAKNTYRLA